MAEPPKGSALDIKDGIYDPAIIVNRYVKPG
jgi:hypothetical protein